jgi:hypothetical protein
MSGDMRSEMENHDILIEIGPDGRVKASVAGAKGKACMQYAKLLEEIVGKITSTELTSEFYEPDSSVRLQLRDESRQGR